MFNLIQFDVARSGVGWDTTHSTDCCDRFSLSRPLSLNPKLHTPPLFPLTFSCLPLHVLLSLSCTHTFCICFCTILLLYMLISIATSLHLSFCALTHYIILPSRNTFLLLYYSGSVSHLSDKSTPTPSQPPRTNQSPLSAPGSPSLFHSSFPPLSACQSHPTLGLGPAFRPLSRAAQEILEICSVDQTGCEDPDLDNDTTAQTLHGLEQELRLMSKGTDTRTYNLQVMYAKTPSWYGHQHIALYLICDTDKNNQTGVYWC